MPEPTAEAENSLSRARSMRDQIAAMQFSLLKPVGAFGVAIADVWADLIAEYASFVADRLRHDARALHAVLHCSSPAELQAIQSTFFQQAIDSYQTEAVRIAALLDNPAPTATGSEEAA